MVALSSFICRIAFASVCTLPIAMADHPAAGRSLLVKLQDADGKPIKNTRVRVYDGSRYFAGRQPRYKTLIVKTNSKGVATFKGFFDIVPEKAGYWIDVLRGKDQLWRSPDLKGSGMKLSRTDAQDPQVQSTVTDDGLSVSVTLRQECPTDIEIVDATTGKRRHFAQLFFKDERVDDWTLAALQDYVGDPGGDDPSRLGLDFFTTMVPEMSDAQFMATREGFYPVEFRLNGKLSVDETLSQLVKLQPAPLVELTVLDIDGNPVEGAKLKYTGPDRRGSYAPTRPTDRSGRTIFLYPEVGRQGRYEIEHQDGTREFSMSDLPLTHDVVWQTNSKPDLGVSNPNFQTDRNRWALIRHTVSLR